MTPLRTSPARATGLLVGLLAAIACVSPAAGASTSSAGIAYVTGGGAGLPSVSVADSSGGNARKLGRGTGPLLSPNGLTVAASDVGSSAHALTLYPATGGTATGYFTAATAASAVAWSPDSRYLAVELTGENAPSISGYGLAIIDTETGIEHVIANGVIYGASFAPGTSDTLVYARAPSLRAGPRRRAVREEIAVDPLHGRPGQAEKLAIGLERGPRHLLPEIAERRPGGASQGDAGVGGPTAGRAGRAAGAGCAPPSPSADRRARAASCSSRRGRSDHARGRASRRPSRA